MKKILILIIVLITSCSYKIKYYHGYIYNIKKRPLKNLKITEDDSQRHFSFTNDKGYFKIKEGNSFGGNLIVSTINGEVLDTIHTIYTQHGEKLNYRFVNGRKDTLFLNVVR